MNPQNAETAIIAKDSGTRLLDMLQGWAVYVEGQERDFPDSVTGEQIQSRYQEMGAYSLQYDSKTTVDQDELTRRFVENRVLPLLLGFRK